LGLNEVPGEAVGAWGFEESLLLDEEEGCWRRGFIAGGRWDVIFGDASRGSLEVGELRGEGGERSVVISPVLGDVAMAPAMVVVMAA
jgi:hypothetical protein